MDRAVGRWLADRRAGADGQLHAQREHASYLLGRGTHYMGSRQ
ncbi:hypothetical protein ACQPYK_28705 [Streptosporangium sp. CA-135522]